MENTTLSNIYRDDVVYLSMYLWFFIACFLSIYRHMEELKKFRNRHIDHDSIEADFCNSETKMISLEIK